MDLLLISNSTEHGRGYLDHVEEEIRELLGAVRRVLFLPFALFDRAAYAAKARARLEAMGLAVDSTETSAVDSDAPVVGLREGAFLRARGRSVLLGGAAGARIFRRGAPPVEARSGDRIDPLLR
ncbi:MAG TPA: Type 1 glutamine amidotransferase-like domain-containing protein [Myxococcales bacterium]